MKKKRSKKLINFIIPIFVALFNVLILLFPADMISASKDGLALWFNNVLPALVPFIIGTNILAGLGVTNFMGVLLSPLMYPIFGVGGAGGFALIAGMTSGYPMGAKITATLRERNDISQTEAQRLCSFVNNAGPLFILGAVGIGMFQSEKIGYYLMAVHYGAALATGFLFKYYRYGREYKMPPTDRLLIRAARSMREGRQRDGRPFGRVLGDSVRNTMETVMQVGGFIILFCVIVKIFEITDITGFVGAVLAPVANHLQINSDIITGFFVGSFEITNGVRVLSQELAFKSQSQAIIAACGIISFGGFSIHAQSASFLSKTDVKISVYLLSKMVHSVIAMAIGSLSLPLFDFTKDTETVYASAMYGGTVIEKLAYSSTWFILSVASGLACFAVYAISKARARR